MASVGCIIWRMFHLCVMRNYSTRMSAGLLDTVLRGALPVPEHAKHSLSWSGSSTRRAARPGAHKGALCACPNPLPCTRSPSASSTAARCSKAVLACPAIHNYTYTSLHTVRTSYY
ncbi:Cadherin-4 [Frankliniella fusca]|uniref:Cadherin-4 n=1 Tax=Frankliniella fusca TaxID=407009 RepID=A0AAE1GU54_9NEOP|nr:Cadherin-4 [Frankliniella fusca]